MIPNKNTSSWLNETPISSPSLKHKYKNPMVVPLSQESKTHPHTIHHYYNNGSRPGVTKTSSLSFFMFCIWLLLGIFIMYLIHCIYTVPDNCMWKQYNQILHF
jgi:hypothetical protein